MACVFFLRDNSVIVVQQRRRNQQSTNSAAPAFKSACVLNERFPFFRPRIPAMIKPIAPLTSKWYWITENQSSLSSTSVSRARRLYKCQHCQSTSGPAAELLAHCTEMMVTSAVQVLCSSISYCDKVDFITQISQRD